MKLNDSTSHRALRWTARILSLASLGVLLMFMIGEGFDPTHLKPRDLMLAVFFPLGLILGLILGWWREWLGGAVVVASLLGFYLVHLAVSGRFPSGWAFAALAAPGVLFVLSALATKPGTQSQSP